MKSTGNVGGVFHTQRGAITVWTAAGATFTGSSTNTGTEWEERSRKGKMDREGELGLTGSRRMGSDKATDTGEDERGREKEADGEQEGAKKASQLGDENQVTMTLGNGSNKTFYHHLLFPSFFPHISVLLPLTLRKCKGHSFNILKCLKYS